jgi:hypothetical protein
LFFGVLFIFDTVGFVSKVSTHKTIVAVHAIKNKCAIGTVDRLLRIDTIIAFFYLDTLVAKLCLINKRTVHRFLTIDDSVAIKTIFVVDSSPYHIAVFDAICLVNIRAILIDDISQKADSRNRKL